MRSASLVLMLLCATIAAEGKEPKHSSNLQQQFDAEFLGKQFVSKVPLAGYVQVRLENGSLAHRLVDTEYGPNGNVSYLVRTGTVESPGFLPPSSHIELEQVNKVYPPGTRFWVIKNELKKDRIELWLTAYSSGQQTVENYAKLKLMLTEGYQGTNSFDDLLLRVGEVFRVERLELIKTLSGEMQSLGLQLDAAETNFKGAPDPVSQYQAGQRLQTVLHQILQNRQRYQEATGKPAEDGQYRQRLDDIQRTLPSLQAKSHEMLVQALRKQLDDNTRQISVLRDRLERPIASSSDLANYKTALTQYSEAISNRGNIIQRMQQENVPLSNAETRVGEDAKLRITVFQNRISADDSRLAVMELDHQYKALAARHNELLNRLLQSLGTATEKSNREKLLSNLDEMRQNRIKAQQLGSKTASAELSKLQDELVRMQR
jgi:hypothetical protein